VTDERRRASDRPLDARLDREDLCPNCGGARRELPAPPGVFYCEACKLGSAGPNTEPPAPPPAPEPEQTGLFSVSEIGQDEGVDPGAEEAPPLTDADVPWDLDG
jgi:ribosomal protein L37AE/L43A